PLPPPRTLHSFPTRRSSDLAEVDVSEFKDLLVAGNNMLAIQALNASASDNDLLAVPQLIARQWTSAGNPFSIPLWYTTDGSDPRMADGTVNPKATRYLGSPINISTSTRIRARTLSGGLWSGMTDQVYDYNVGNLRVTELNYNPAPPPAGSLYNNDDFEFIELKNYASVPLNLQGMQFTNGITFTFGNVTLDPGQVGVVVKNLAAFQSRYGTGAYVL